MSIGSKKQPTKSRVSKKQPQSKMEASEIATASAIIKKYASKQKIIIKLTPDQEQAILKQWDDKDPYSPAEIIFKVGDKSIIDLKVAAYRYKGDTCCV
ncbi:MAG: hypothetical protein HZA84_01190 [Thaumarchaeota archaeon]|nr:hypothetical protein [Nitrososphaerota archaeon]